MRIVRIFTLLALAGCVSCASGSPQALDEDSDNKRLEDDLSQHFEEVREAYFASADSPETPQEDRVRIKLHESLFSFSEENSISTYELSSMLGGLAIDGEKWPKAGVGTLGHPLYVMLEGENNAVLLGEDREWVGKPSSEAEIVLISNDRKIVDESLFDYDDGVIIFFSPDEVRFVDFSSNTGGRYMRASDFGACE